jgi:uroporphyrinogen-III synthase
MKALLVLRPEPGASATVKRARDQGMDARAVPLFVVEPIDWQPPDPSLFDGLLITSANAVRNGGEGLIRLRGLQVYAVGEASAEVARAAGFGIAASGDSGVGRLLRAVDPRLKLLHLCGEDRHDPEGSAPHITAVPVYRARAVDAPDIGAPAGTVALVHSPRSGARFAELVGDRSATTIVALSEAAAAAAGDGWQSVNVAQQPTDGALLALAARLCNKPAL